MSHRTSLAFAAAMVIATASTPQFAQAGPPSFDPDIAYAATRVIEAAEQRIEQRYFQKNAATQRMETLLHGQQSTVIINAERGVMIMVMAGQRSYLEAPIDGRAFDGMSVELPDPATWVFERIGRESVHGVPATRYRVASDTGATPRIQGQVWVSDHGVPVRSDMMTGGDRVLMELRDLVVGPQPAALFLPPTGYQRMAFGDGMMGGLGGAMGPATSSVPGAPDSPAGPDGNAAPGFIDELSDAAAEEAKRTTTEEVRGTVDETVRRGLRNILRGN